jgi:hypothetical protein
MQDWVYVENVVHAQLLLEGALSDSPNSPAGKVRASSSSLHQV